MVHTDAASREQRLLLRRLGLVPQCVHLGERRLTGRLSARSERALDRSKAALELLIGRTQHRFRIGIEMARKVDHGEQQIAGLRGCLSALVGGEGFDERSPCSRGAMWPPGLLSPR